MVNCKECVLLSDTYSQLRAEWEDSLPIGERPATRFCIIFDNGIPQAIWDGQEVCPFKLQVTEEVKHGR